VLIKNYNFHYLIIRDLTQNLKHYTGIFPKLIRETQTIT